MSWYAFLRALIPGDFSSKQAIPGDILPCRRNNDLKVGVMSETPENGQRYDP